MQKVKTHKRKSRNGVTVVREHLRKKTKKVAKKLYKNGGQRGITGMRMAIGDALERESIERGHTALRRKVSKSRKK